MGEYWNPKNNNRSGARSRVTQNKSPSNPPRLVPTLIIKNHRCRFVVNSAGGGTRQIDSKDLMDLFCVATAANAATRILDGIKIKSIEMWAANSAGNASNTVQLEFLNQAAAGIGGPGVVFNDTAIGLNDIAHLKAQPPRNSTAASWITGFSTTDILEFVLPQGSVVDVIFDLVLCESETASNVTGAVAGGTVGKLYCRPLDSTNVTPIMIPVGFDYI